MSIPRNDPSSVVHKRAGTRRIKETPDQCMKKDNADVKERKGGKDLEPDGADLKPSEITCFLLEDNPFILSGFREYTECSFLECSKSIFHVHNDTMNVWTHFIGAFWAIYAMYNTLSTAQAVNSPFMEKLLFVLFYSFTFICFSSSGLYHVYRSHSIRMYRIFLTFDVGSIGLQIFGSVALIAYFELKCFPDIRDKWLAFMLAFFIFVVGSVPYLLRHKKTSVRTFLLVSFALSGLASHMLRAYLTDFHWTSIDLHKLQYLMLTYISSGLGLTIRRTKIPEYFFPGKFDIWLSSHQIFHVLVVVAPWCVHTGYSTLISENLLCNLK